MSLIPFLPWEIFPSEPAAAVLPWAPDWADGVQESLSWKMGNATSQSGVEHRRSVRRDPRQRIEFSTLVLPEDMPLLQSLLLGWANQVWAVPLWYGQVSLTIAAAPGDDILDTTTGTATLFQVGGWALVWSDERTMEFAQVLDISDTLVLLDSPLVGNFPIGSKVVPLQFMTLQDSQTFAPLTSAITKVAWAFEQVPGHAQALALGGRLAQQRLALPQHLTRRGHLLARQTGKTGRLARTVGANQGHALACGHREVHTVQRPHAAKVLGQTADLQNRSKAHARPLLEAKLANSICSPPSTPLGASTITSMMTKPKTPRQ